MNELFVRITSWLYGERGDWNYGGGLGLVGVVLLIIIFLYLTERGGVTNIFD